VARLTQNINIFRKELREIRSHKPKKGTVLEQVLAKAAMPRKIEAPAKKQAKKSPAKATKTKKTTSTSSAKKTTPKRATKASGGKS
jgi:DNA-binding winged helix-turn-helix (wHTH) protein